MRKQKKSFNQWLKDTGTNNKLEYSKQQLKKFKSQLADLDKLKLTVDQRKFFKNHYEKEIKFWEGRTAALQEASRDHTAQPINDINVTFEAITS